ncbi:MAG: hypothetical protein AB7S38_11710 [Vulcanimicrobiota bacterium]
MFLSQEARFGNDARAERAVEWAMSQLGKSGLGSVELVLLAVEAGGLSLPVDPTIVSILAWGRQRRRRFLSAGPALRNPQTLRAGDIAIWRKNGRSQLGLVVARRGDLFSTVEASGFVRHREHSLKSRQLTGFVRVFGMFGRPPEQLGRLGKPASWRGSPPCYFAFASQPIGSEAVASLARRYGRNVMIGVDPTQPGWERTDQEARRLGLRRHVYLEGPGGPQADRWHPQTRRRLAAAAREQGIDPCRSGWMRRWDANGWKAHTLAQLRMFHREGFESAEIDHLGRVLGEDWLQFLREYAGWFEARQVPRLTLKNVDAPRMRSLVRAVRWGELPRQMFGDFHLWDAAARPLEGADRLAQELGIRTLMTRPGHIHNQSYEAFGAY